MHLLAAALSLVVALDGESSQAANSTGTAIIAAVSMVFGYVLIAALWWFVFRDRARERSRRRRGPSE
jgi:hypothetical protein